MAPVQVAVLLLTFALVTALGHWVFWFKKRERRLAIPAVISLAVLAYCVAAASLAAPGQNAVLSTWWNQGQLDRTYLVCLGAGASAGIMGLAALLAPRSALIRAASWIGYLGVVGGLSLLAVKDTISRFVPTPQELANLQADATQSRFSVRKVASLTIFPTSVAVDESGVLYVSGYEGVSYQHGVVLQLKRDAQGTYQSAPAVGYLNRPHGVAVHHGDLYVSRSGQFSRAINGVIIQENTGAVTRFRDLDGDGKFDHAEDVLSNLPGSQQPDGLHQNNGIVLDANGQLFATVSIPSDHGPGVHPYAGCILRTSAEGGDVTVFARGFRNPYDLAVDGQGRLFGTDNDAGDEKGDKLVRISEGDHFGHPYTAVDGQMQVAGAVEPLLRMKSAQGLCYAPAGSLSPGLDDCLYVASFTEGRVYRISVSQEGDKATAEFVASVPQCVDLAVGQGSLFALSHEGRAVFELVPKSPSRDPS